MKNALVIGGATGLLGKALVRVLTANDWKVGTLGREDGDLMNVAFLKEKLKDADVIFNTVAWTQVDDAEDHEREADEINRVFPSLLANALAERGSGHLCQYSTDFVFSGVPPHPWRETDTPCPQSVYGKTKLAGEEAVLKILPDRSCVLRTAWLFGGGRKNFVDTILHACSTRDVIKVVDDQSGSPTYTLDLAKWSAELAEKRVTGIWNAVNSGRASWCEFAAEAIALASAPCKLVPVSSAEWPQKAKRPENSVLDNSKLEAFLGKKPRPWPQALRDYIFGDYLVRGQEKKC